MKSIKLCVVRDFLSLILFFCISGVSDNRVNSSEKTFRESLNFSEHRPFPTVIGGYQADMAEFPYAVRLYILKKKLLIMCTGEAVHPVLVMTAAHCVDVDSQIVVVTGNANQDDYMSGRDMEKYARYKVVDVFVHPKFNKVQYVHDVAIVKLGRRMLHRGYKVISISYEKLTGPMKSVIFGWGVTDTNKHNNQLYGKKLNATNCTLKSAQSDPHQYVCLMEKGICHGDSGGGLIIGSSLHGIASFYQKEKVAHCILGNNYYYTAMSEEESFVRDCIRKNDSNYNHCFHFLMTVTFILSFLF